MTDTTGTADASGPDNLDESESGSGDEAGAGRTTLDCARPSDNRYRRELRELAFLRYVGIRTEKEFAERSICFLCELSCRLTGRAQLATPTRCGWIV
ncbi:hypothetical protein JK2ML_0025 [Mycobacterium leprae Kyoto-2]|uniref:Uncharacterized protein n=3 Tax=Mycobacterium leprae TaxID=1769 RepID=Q9CDE1_MYCLE|nr:hypothetical protein DIJ64_00135 [Mycobacterium leprae]OAR19540.1 hypothetical protein A8144_04540 [Mycobacterium leprae 3125609]OAX71565.1 hypothetical protein A3216_05100 [Mycobacterium leprae 7935681]CAR70118.1 hypothetical protein MLBr00025 [Mycobacterium leprae Br4923]BBC16313.1 hypothetical protein JK2ML_0025 [Mycobacterium leprae Kyoto-2]